MPCLCLLSGRASTFSMPVIYSLECGKYITCQATCQIRKQNIFVVFFFIFFNEIYILSHFILRCTLLVYVEWASRVDFVTIFGDLYQNKLWVI